MRRLIVQYGQPTDPAEFDRHDRDVHVGLASAIPGLQRLTIGHPASMDPHTPAPYLVAELDFESAEAMAAGMGFEADRAAGADGTIFATGGATIAGFYVDDVTPAG